MNKLPEPLNNLERALVCFDGKMAVQAIAEAEALVQTEFLCCLESELFTDETAFFVLCFGVSRRQLDGFAPSVSCGRLQKLIAQTRSPLASSPDPQEKELIKAIISRNSADICRLVREERACFKGFAPELLVFFPALSQEALITLLREGVTPRLKALLTGFFLSEAETPDVYEDLSYGERIKYANLMLHILQEEHFSAEREVYPANSSGGFSYYFDPEHRFAPDEFSDVLQGIENRRCR